MRRDRTRDTLPWRAAKVTYSISLVLAATCALAFNIASAAEGCLVASKQLRTIALLYAASPLITTSVLLVFSGFAATLGPTHMAGALAAWLAFTTFHATRLAVFTGRLRKVP